MSRLGAIITHGLFVILLFTFVFVSLFGATVLAAYALSYVPTLVPKSPYFYDLNGERLYDVVEGKPVVIATTFTNYKEERVPFVGILEVRDSNCVTVLLSWQSSTVEPLGNKTMGVSWVIPETASYQSRAFAFTSFEQPQVLSAVQSFEISKLRN